MQLSIRDVTFAYEGSYENVFDHLTVNLDTSWRLGLIGRNGRGKTTLLNLLLGRYACQGHIQLPLQPVYFPFPVENSSQLSLFVMQQAAPDVEDWQLIRECNLLKVEPDVLYRPFDTLSRGEQTKLLLAALFSRQDVYPLIDEPTNHLDAHGRAIVADYLRRKDGFLLVSHDRAFLNRCIDHVLSLNRSDAWVMQGNYDDWQQRFDRQNQQEADRSQQLKGEISRLEESARQAAAWSAQGEKGKFHTPPSKSAVTDRGYIGARSARMMKRSLSTLRRREQAVEEKKSLLHNVERPGELKLTTLSHPKQTLITVKDGQVRYGDRTVCDGINFAIRQGDRVALTGPNGAGKSSVLKTLCGLSGALTGEIRPANGLVVSYVPQETDFLQGGMRDYALANGLDESLFKAILRNLGMEREAFDRDLSTFSQGQKKKVLLAASLCAPAHLYVWDEPLNYMDVFSRMQVEQLILDFRPTLLLVEHDQFFLQRVTNRANIVLKSGENRTFRLTVMD